MNILRYIIAIAGTFISTFLILRGQLIAAIPISLFVIVFTHFELRYTKNEFAKKIYNLAKWWGVSLLSIIIISIIVIRLTD